MHLTLETVPSIFLKSEEIIGRGTSEDSFLTLRANETVLVDSIGKLVSVFILVMLSTWILEMRNFNS